MYEHVTRELLDLACNASADRLCTNSYCKACDQALCSFEIGERRADDYRAFYLHEGSDDEESDDVYYPGVYAYDVLHGALNAPNSPIHTAEIASLIPEELLATVDPCSYAFWSPSAQLRDDEESDDE